MNELQKFFYTDKEIRVVTKEGEPWFVAADVCRVLEIDNATKALVRLDDDEKALISIQGISRGNDNMTVWVYPNTKEVQSVVSEFRQIVARRRAQA